MAINAYLIIPSFKLLEINIINRECELEPDPNLNLFLV